MSTLKNTKTLKMVQTAVLAAVIVLMAFTPLGFLKVGVVEISFLMLPVAIGAILLGPTSGAILGATFGISSFIQCFGMSPFGAQLLTISPVFTFITCIVPRVLVGLLCGLIFKAISKVDKSKWLATTITGLSAALLNTAFFILCLVMFFYNTQYIQSIAANFGTHSVFAFILAFVGINGLIEACVCLVLTTAICKPLLRLFKQKPIEG